jgi:hypothetical protein
MCAIINYINKKNINFFDKLANNLKVNSGKILEIKIKKLFYDLKIKEKNKYYIKNKKKLFFLKKYMQTPGRSDNFIYPVNENFLNLILKNSYF